MVLKSGFLTSCFLYVYQYNIKATEKQSNPDIAETYT